MYIFLNQEGLPPRMTTNRDAVDGLRLCALIKAAEFGFRLVQARTQDIDKLELISQPVIELIRKSKAQISEVLYGHHITPTSIPYSVSYVNGQVNPRLTWEIVEVVSPKYSYFVAKDFPFPDGVPKSALELKVDSQVPNNVTIHKTAIYIVPLSPKS